MGILPYQDACPKLTVATGKMFEGHGDDQTPYHLLTRS